MNVIEEIGRVLMITIMFWNLENYFDPFEGAAGNDFTPGGEKHWTWKKFCAKRDLISKIILSTKDAYRAFPSIIGVCEVENRYVLEQLTAETSLNALGYKILHRNSIDKRGIDVALLYRAEQVKILEEEYFPHRDTLIAHNLRTRYVLYAKCVVKEAEDTLHLFVNHWPSKLGSNENSNSKSVRGQTVSPRMFISNAVKAKCDSLLFFDSNARIILMGDFNDIPDSEPIRNLCLYGEDSAADATVARTVANARTAANTPINAHEAQGFTQESQMGSQRLINLARTQSTHTWGSGSYKFKDHWEAIDQFIVRDSAGMKMSVFTHPSLFKEDKNFLGKQINRTIKGPRYTGGASDHLPIVLRIELKIQSKKCNFNL